MHTPLTGPCEIGPRHAREAAAVADVRAAAIERVELGLKELVAGFERALERLVVLPVADERHEVVLVGVFTDGVVQCTDDRQISGDRPRERCGSDQNAADDDSARGSRAWMR